MSPRNMLKGYVNAIVWKYSIPLEYLTGLHERHEDMIKRYKERGVPVIVVDATRDIKSDGEYFKNILPHLG